MIRSWLDGLKTNVSASQKRDRLLRQELQKLITRRGSTTGRHSALGGTLSYYILGLEQAKVPYKLEAWPGIGYVLTSLPDLDLHDTALTDPLPRPNLPLKSVGRT